MKSQQGHSLTELNALLREMSVLSFCRLAKWVKENSRCIANFLPSFLPLRLVFNAVFCDLENSNADIS